MRRPLAVCVVALAAIGGVLTLFQLRSPRHGGKSVDYWTRSLTSTNESTQSNAVVALRALGTNALPALLARTAAEDSLLVSNAARLLRKQSVLSIPVPSAANDYREARLGLEALGTNANAAIPALLKMLEDPRTANRASGLLCNLNNEVIPALIIATTNADVQVRRRSITDLGWRHVNTPGVVDCLAKALVSDPDAMARAMAASGLRGIPELPESAMEPLLKALDDPDERYVASSAAQTLGDCFGSRARAAVPRLVQLWQKHGIWTGAAESLTKIDPETARKHGAFVESRPNPYE